jgi:hypothetical protein
MLTILKASLNGAAGFKTYPDLTGPDRSPVLRFTGPGKTSGALPFSLDAMGHVRLQAHINGVAVDAILDTGAARTVLDETFVRRLGLAAQPGFLVAGITGVTAGAWSDPIRLTIGDLTLDHLRPGVLDLRPFAAAGRPASILIGRELFERTLVDFDFAGGTVSFLEASARPPIAASHTAPLGMTAGGTPYVAIALNGAAPIHAALDIGYNGALMVSPDYAASAGLLIGRPTSTVASVGAEGMSINTIATCDRLEFAGSELFGAPIETPSSWNRSIPAVLGLDILRRFRMLAEYGRQRVSFVPDAGLAQTPLPKDRSGLGARPTPDGIVIMHVAKGSPAEQAGIQSGDVIVRIDGAVADLDYVQTHPRMGTRPAGASFVLQFNDGRIVPLTLAEYY